MFGHASHLLSAARSDQQNLVRGPKAANAYSSKYESPTPIRNGTLVVQPTEGINPQVLPPKNKVHCAIVILCLHAFQPC